MSIPMKRSLRFLFAAMAAGMLLGATGCTTVKDKVYYGTLEKFGVHKRDVLVDRVDEARKSQQDAKVEFQDALQAFMSVVDVKGSELEEVYKRLDKQLGEAEDQAERVRNRIDAVEEVARALFSEWETELNQYGDQRLRRESEQQLKQTRELYDEMLISMHSAEDRMQPVLQAFNDRVLFLKHNLNAMAISSLQTEAVAVRRDVEQLVREMERAIADADDFIAKMRSGNN